MIRRTSTVKYSQNTWKEYRELKQNAFLTSGVLRTRNDIKSLFAEQTGGNFASVPMSGLIGGTADNYDGSTNITADTLETYLQSMIVVGRAHSWLERDFSLT